MLLSSISWFNSWCLKSVSVSSALLNLILIHQYCWFAGRICWCFFSLGPDFKRIHACTRVHVNMPRQSFANVISGPSPLHSFSTTDLQLPRLYLASVVFPLQLLIKNGVCVSWTRHSHDSPSDVIPRPISGLQAVDRWFSARPGSFGTPAMWGHLYRLSTSESLLVEKLHYGIIECVYGDFFQRYFHHHDKDCDNNGSCRLLTVFFCCLSLSQSQIFMYKETSSPSNQHCFPTVATVFFSLLPSGGTPFKILKWTKMLLRQENETMCSTFFFHLVIWSFGTWLKCQISWPIQFV